MPPKRHLQPEEMSAEKRAKKSPAISSTYSPSPSVVTGVVPFSVKYPVQRKPAAPGKKEKPLSKREAELLKQAEFLISPFVARGRANYGDLDRPYTVVPNLEWEGMRKYSNFIIQGETYRHNQYVFVKGESVPVDGGGDEHGDYWVAKILQVRASNPQHVYALVAWMYWPHELPPPKTKTPFLFSKDCGHSRYHGRHELIASNHMDVLDVLSFAGKADVSQWMEEDDNIEPGLFWRQTIRQETNELSEIRKHCICEGHHNPDIQMYICDNSSCKTWLHLECIIDKVLMAKLEALAEKGDAGATKALQACGGLKSTAITNGTASSTSSLGTVAPKKRPRASTGGGGADKKSGPAWKDILSARILPTGPGANTTATSTTSVGRGGNTHHHAAADPTSAVIKAEDEGIIDVLQPPQPPLLRITDLRSGAEEDERIACLKCGTVLE